MFDAYELDYLDVLLESGERFADKLERQKAGMEKKRQALSERLQSCGCCIIFSAGSHGSNLQILLKTALHHEITAFCDNSPQKQGKEINGVPVLSPQEAVQKYPDAVYLIANKQYGLQIKGQLADMKIAESKILDCRVEELVDGFL